MSGHSHKNDNTKSWDVIDQVQNHSIDVQKREIYLFPREDYLGSNHEEGAPEPGVEYGMANQFIRNLRILSNRTEDPILVHMKTCGGYWEEGLAIYQAIRSCPNHVTILNYASARSMSSLIFLAADLRAMMPYSTFMIHRGEACITGTGTQVDTEYEQLMKAEEQMFDIYIEALRGSEKMAEWSDKRIKNWIKKKMHEKEDVYFSAEEAIDYNFADMIFGADGTYDWSVLKKA